MVLLFTRFDSQVEQLSFCPNFLSLRLKNLVLDHNFLTNLSPFSESSSENAAWQVAVTEGGCEVENKNGRAR